MVGKRADSDGAQDASSGIHQNNKTVACSLPTIGAHNGCDVHCSGDNAVADGHALNTTAIDTHVD